MNLPPAQRFEAAPHQLNQAAQQEMNRQQVRAGTREVQANALLNAYKTQLDMANGMDARIELLNNMKLAGLASGGLEKLGPEVAQYAGLT